MERRGSGFKKIMDDYKFQENYTEKLKPEFYAKYDSFILTLYNLNYLEGQDDTQDDTQDVPQSGTHDGTHDVPEGVPEGVPQNVPEGVPQENLDKQILEIIKDNSNVTTEMIAQKLNVSVKTVKRHIKKMDSVSYVGGGYSGHWEVTDNGKNSCC
jgi:ATP-dependent DNA helicase RecG